MMNAIAVKLQRVAIIGNINVVRMSVLLLACLSSATVICQFYPSVDSLNRQTDGVKVGFHVAWVSQDLVPTKERHCETRDCFRMLVYYFENELVFPVFPVDVGGAKLETKMDLTVGDTLSGQYSLHKRRSGRMIEQGEFKNGVQQWVRTYYTNGELRESVEYHGQECEGLFSAVTQAYDRRGRLKSSESRCFENGKWRIRKFNWKDPPE